VIVRGVILAAFLASAALFSLSATHFIAAPTDVSAWRVTLGDVPYRDFWTMYAPGSFTVLAWLYEWFGREMLVTRVAGGLTAAAAMAALAVLVIRVGGRGAVLLPVGMTAMVFFATGYHTRFGSYPPVLVLIFAAVGLMTTRSRSTTDPRLHSGLVAGAGLLVGTAVLFKHDVAGYAAVALGLAILVTPGVAGRHIGGCRGRGARVAMAPGCAAGRVRRARAIPAHGLSGGASPRLPVRPPSQR
jgi:hypothetical protein